jgi:acyl-CoA oxidase
MSEKKSPIRPSVMYEILEGPFYALKNDVVNFLLHHKPNLSEQFTKDEYRTHVLQVVKLLADKGYGALAFDKAYGGENALNKYMAVFESLSKVNLNYAIKYGVQFGLFGGAIHSLGTKYHHDTYLKDTGTTSLLGCFGMTETGHGSNVKDIETTATYNHGDGTITIHSPTKSAGKEYIGNALHGSVAVVFAQLFVKNINHGVHAFIVPYRDKNGNLLANIEVKDCGYKMGLNGIDNGRLWFNQIQIPKENLLNKYGEIDAEGNYTSPIQNANKRFFVMLGALVGGRMCVGLGGINAAQVAMATALKYAMRRRQFKADEDKEEEMLLIDYPTHQHRLLPLLVKSIVYKISLHQLCAQFHTAQEDDLRKIETKAAGLKAIATWLATKTIQECREACGGKGYLKENGFADLKADSDIFTTFEGDNTVLMQLVAKGLLTDFKQAFNDDGFLATIKYIGEKIGMTLSEFNIYQARKTSEEHLMDDTFLSETLRYREKKMIVSLADRMRAYVQKKVPAQEAFLKSQVHMVDAARAYIERLAYRNTVEKINTLPASPEKILLEKINRFYALSLIMDHRYFYLESDYMDGSKTKAIRKVYSSVMADMYTYLPELIESLGIPDELTTIHP